MSKLNGARPIVIVMTEREWLAATIALSKALESGLLDYEQPTLKRKVRQVLDTIDQKLEDE